MKADLIDNVYGFNAYGSYMIDQYWWIVEDNGHPKDGVLLQVSVRYNRNDEYASHAMATFIDDDTAKMTDINFVAPESVWMEVVVGAEPTRTHPEPTEAFTAVIRGLVDRATSIAALYA
jgi:hypothetical protein